MMSVLGFLVILAPLVVFHEFGHYFFAKLFNVKAEIFSIGFGPRLFSKNFGETEFRVSAIPLGGYVKLFGEDPSVKMSEAEAKRALQRQVPWKRFFIFFGGPLFNFILAIFIFMAILAIGEPQIASVVGRVEEGSYAEKIGFQNGDRILSLNSENIVRFSDLMFKINELPNQTINVSVLRTGKSQPDNLQIKTSSEEGYSVYGEMGEVGAIPGLLPMGRMPIVGVSNPQSKAFLAGIRTLDEVIEFQGKKLESWEVIVREYRTLPNGGKWNLKVRSKSTNLIRELSFDKPQNSKSLEKDLGLFSSEMFIDKAVEGSPAEKAGLKNGDRIVTVGGEEIKSFFGLRDAIQKHASGGKPVEITWERDGKAMQASILPNSVSERDPVLRKITRFTIGITPLLFSTEPATIIERIWNPLTLFVKATDRMLVITWRNIVSIGKMFTGDVSVKTLGGPILIGKLAGDSIERGLIAFLTTMAVLSIGLGILNVLPVPVLDGGHLVLLLIETIRGRPLSIRQMEVIQQVGFSLILLLMVVVIKNDISRLPIFN